MADPVYLGLWVRGFSEQSMLGAWAVALAEFPVSSLAPGIREMTVYPFQWGEAPVLEWSFQDGAEPAEPLAAPEDLQDSVPLARRDLPPAAVHAADVAKAVALAAE